MNARLLTFLVILLLAANTAYSTQMLKIRLVNTVNGEPLVLNDKTYTNAKGNEFTVSMYKYYISSFSLINNGSTVYSEPSSYHLVNEGRPSSKKFELDVPAVTCTAVRFLIGVDSLHNVSGAQSDALDPINAMFWDWNTGYIMAKVEGRSPQSAEGTVEFHIGGYAGKYATQRWVTLQLPRPLHVSGDKSITITIASDIAEWFKSPNTINFAEMPVVTTEGDEAVKIADNYGDMFTIESVEEK